MTRGGYLLIIGFLIGLFAYQTYSTERMFDRYEDVISKQELSKDSISSIGEKTIEMNAILANKISTLADSLSNIKPDTIVINKTVVQRFKNDYYVENRDYQSQ